MQCWALHRVAQLLGDASNAQPDILARVALGDASQFGTVFDALLQEEIRMVTSGTVRWQCHGARISSRRMLIGR